nr:hypothetical protein [Tanacetum cinerariifolium]
REVANERPLTEVKQMMTDEFCPTKEVQRLEDELRHLKLRDMNIAAYMESFNELGLLCPDSVPNEKKKVELYIKGFPEIIKGEITSSRPATLNEAVTTLGREVANGRPLTKVKQMITDEFCPTEEVQRLEDELRHLKLRDMNIATYMESFNELGLLCPDSIPNEKKKVELYIKGFPEIIKGANQTEIAPKCNCCGRCHFDQCPPKCENCRRIGHKAKDFQSKNVASGAIVQPNVVCYECGERGHKSRACPKKADRQGGRIVLSIYIG